MNCEQATKLGICADRFEAGIRYGAYLFVIITEREGRETSPDCCWACARWPFALGFARTATWITSMLGLLVILFAAEELLSV